IRGDIVNTLTDLFVSRVKNRVPYFTRAVIETTGLADPAPVLHALMSDPIVGERYMIDGVVTTVDAVNGDGTLDRQPEAVKQAAVADRLLLTKTDLAEPDALAALQARLRVLNPGAPQLPAALSGWLDALASIRGDDLLRLKAIVAIADRPDQPVVLHGVQHLFHPPVFLPSWPSEDRRTRIVFITRGLPRETIEESLAAFE